MITIGTNDKNSMMAGDSWYFLRMINGATRDSHVARPHPTMVSKIKLEEGMFKHHPTPAPD